MPYIKQYERESYDSEIESLVQSLGRNGFHPGHFVYIVYKLALRWWEATGSFSDIAEIRGALMSVLSELDRREFFDYEDQKIKENGDI